MNFIYTKNSKGKNGVLPFFVDRRFFNKKEEKKMVIMIGHSV